MRILVAIANHGTGKRSSAARSGALTESLAALLAHRVRAAPDQTSPNQGQFAPDAMIGPHSGTGDRGIEGKGRGCRQDIRTEDSDERHCFCCGDLDVGSTKSRTRDVAARSPTCGASGFVSTSVSKLRAASAVPSGTPVAHHDRLELVGVGIGQERVKAIANDCHLDVGWNDNAGHSMALPDRRPGRSGAARLSDPAVGRTGCFSAAEGEKWLDSPR